MAAIAPRFTPRNVGEGNTANWIACLNALGVAIANNIAGAGFVPPALKAFAGMAISAGILRWDPVRQGIARGAVQLYSTIPPDQLLPPGDGAWSAPDFGTFVDKAVCVALTDAVTLMLLQMPQVKPGAHAGQPPSEILNLPADVASIAAELSNFLKGPAEEAASFFTAAQAGSLAADLQNASSLAAYVQGLHW